MLIFRLLSCLVAATIQSAAAGLFPDPGQLVDDIIRNLVDLGFSPSDPSFKTNDIHDIHGEYDFIVVGSGSAGSVIANRLSEIPEWKVLLVEAGKPENIFGSVPMLAPTLQMTSYNWNYATEPEEHACQAMIDKRCAWPKGKALGGSSAINYMIYTRGNRGDFDRWALHVNDTSWNYRNVLPYFIKSENVHLKHYEENFHGHLGYLSTGDTFRSEIADAFLTAGQQLGHKLVDYNGLNQQGFSFLQSTTLKGRRHSVARAFLQPINARRNLHVLTETMATKITIKDGRATGVSLRFRGYKFHVRARKEVIISSGPFNSPQLLMLSGIGPADHLHNLKIPLVKDLPVGYNLMDHPAYVGLSFLMNQTIERAVDSANPKKALDWFLTGEGPLSSLGGSEAIGFINTGISRYNRDIPDVELLFSGGDLTFDYGAFTRRTFRIRDDYYYKAFKDIESHPSWTVFPVLLQAKSRGRVMLRSADPLDPPLLHANYYTDPDAPDNDKRTLIAAIRHTIALSETPAFQKYASRLSEIPVPDCEHLPWGSDAYWSCALERFTVSIHHQTGTCRMGIADDGVSVVDSEFRVFGVGALRVADSSVMPVSLCAHTNAPTIMLGEKVSDAIKFTHK